MMIPPIAQAVIMCDCVHRESVSGKYNLLGTFNSLAFPSFPGKLPIMFVFLSLVEVNGTYDLRIQLVDVDEEFEPIAQVSGTLVGNYPLAIYEFPLHLQDVEFPRTGEYRLQLFAHGTQIAERRLFVLHREVINHG